MEQESPAKAHLRDVVDHIRHSNNTYATMTNKQLKILRETAQKWLDDHPDNEAALKRYELLVDEIARRGL